MARLNIDLGTAGNPNTGDSLRVAMAKINDNFSEVYSSITGTAGYLTSGTTNGNVVIQPNGTGVIELDQLQITDDSITSLATNASIDITGNGTGGVNIEALSFNGTSISSSDSTAINLNENVIVDGNITVTGSITGNVTVTSIDADSTTVSNLEVDNFKASAVVTEAEGLNSSDNDTSFPTTAAVKDYVDNTATGDLTISGSTISAPSNADLSLNAGGTGSVDIEAIQIKGTEISSADSTQVTIKENLLVTGNIETASDLTVGSISIADNTITTSASNANLELTASGTGSVDIEAVQIKGTEISSADSTQITIKENLHVTGNISGTFVGTVAALETQMKAFVGLSVVGDDSTGTSFNIGESIKIAGAGSVTTAMSGDTLTITGSSSGSTGDLAITGSSITAPSNADLTLSAGGTGSVDIEGVSITDNTISTGSSNANLELTASGSGAVKVDAILSLPDGSASDNYAGFGDDDDLKLFHNGSHSIIRETGTGSLYLQSDNNVIIGKDSGSETMIKGVADGAVELYHDNSKKFETTASGVSVTGTINIDDGISITDNTITSSASNADLELKASGTGGIVAQGPVTFNAGYIEKINALTSSSTITVDCSLASIHTVTLGTSTEFNISNLPTGGSVTLIITQDGSGNRTATFGTDGSSAVKFPSNSSTLSTGAADIDVVTIINDGTNFLGNIAKDYRSS